MATYYTIHMQDLPSGTEHYFSTEVFESFDDACDALDKEIVKHDKNFVKPDRAKMRELTDSPVYHRMPLQMFGLMKRTFVPKKHTKKYVYRYYVENFKSYKPTITLTEQKRYGDAKKSKTFDSFDEAVDALDKELRELHAGSYWEPRMNRDEFRAYMGDGIAATYDFFKEDKYVLSRQQV